MSSYQTENPQGPISMMINDFLCEEFKYWGVINFSKYCLSISAGLLCSQCAPLKEKLIHKVGVCKFVIFFLIFK